MALELADGILASAEQAQWPIVGELDLAATLVPLRHGGLDPTGTWADGFFWWASRTPEGPATVRLGRIGGQMGATAWGSGRSWALEQSRRLIPAPADGDLEGHSDLVGRLRRKRPGLRLCRSERVVEALVPFILEQKVTSVEAKRGWRRLVRRYGEAAPGPAALIGIKLPPTPERQAALPYWAFHPLGIEAKRANIIRNVCGVAAHMEAALDMSPTRARIHLELMGGIGPWTSAHVVQVTMGAVDEVVTGDFHFPHIVTHAFTGRRRGSDELMLELLEPYRPYRGLAQRLIVNGVPRRKRRAPKAPLRDLRHI